MNHLSYYFLEKELFPRMFSTDCRSVAVFDIDSTIMNTTPRNMKILTDLAAFYPELRPAVSRISESDIGWGIIDVLGNYAELDPGIESEIRSFWKARFFENSYLIADTPYDGALDLIKYLIDMNIQIVYLTGRDFPNMSKGTIESFVNHGFPVSGNASFIFKPDFDEPDLDFKIRAMEEIKEMGNVILAVENEPANANVIKASCPKALVLLINTITSPQPEDPVEGIISFDFYPESASKNN